MDPASRGFHAHLVLVAARARVPGVLPDDDARWRKWLGLPASYGAHAPGAPKKTQRKPLPETLVAGLQALLAGDERGLAALRSGETSWHEYLWQEWWKPQVLTAWQRVDAQAVAEYPHLAGTEGQWWCPTAVAMALTQNPPAAAKTDAAHRVASPLPAKPGRSPRAKKSEAPAAAPALSLQAAWGEPVDDLWLVLTQDTRAWRSPEAVLAAWRVPVPSEQRQGLWDLGVACLTPSSRSPAEARSFLGRLIKQFGEKAVGEAVAELGRRAVAPADARSFLQGLLTRTTEGSAAEQRARSARATVAL